MGENQLAESDNYIVSHEWESVILKNKITRKEIIIGDFYGEPDLAVISKDEKFCVMGGCGVIVYFLHKPFKEYNYNIKTSQWKEWRRSPPDIVWVENAKILDEQHIEIETEDGSILKFNIYTDL